MRTIESLYCHDCGNYLMAGDGHCHDCPCGWTQPVYEDLEECEPEDDECD